MSVQAITWATNQKTGSGTRKAVLVALANRHNNDTGKCCPRVKFLVAETEFSERTVRQALTDLEEMGLIRRNQTIREDGGLGVSNYTLNLANLTPPGAAAAGGVGAAAAPQEPEVNLEPEELLGEDKPARPRDPLWDALVEVLRTEPATKTERGRWNAALKELREAAATPEQLKVRANAYRRRYPDAALTPTALAANWGSLTVKVSVKKPETVEDEPVGPWVAPPTWQQILKDMPA